MHSVPSTNIDAPVHMSTFVKGESTKKKVTCGCYSDNFGDVIVY